MGDSGDIMEEMKILNYTLSLENGFIKGNEREYLEAKRYFHDLKVVRLGMRILRLSILC